MQFPMNVFDEEVEISEDTERIQLLAEAGLTLEEVRAWEWLGRN